MTYQLQFLYASLALMTIVYVHFRMTGNRFIFESKIFVRFLSICISDVVLDIITSKLIDRADPNLCGISTIMMVLFLVNQMVLPWIFLYYMQTVRHIDLEEKKRFSKQSALVPALMILICVTTPVTRWVVWFDTSGSYMKGPLYMVTYGYAIVYLIYALVHLLIYRNQYTKRDYTSFLTYFNIFLISTVFQMVMGKVMIIGFGLGLGITLMYITVSNPMRYMDSVTSAYNTLALDNLIDQSRKNSLYGIIVEITSLSQVNTIFGVQAGDKVLRHTARELRSMTKQGYVFRVAGNQFVTIIDDFDEYLSVLDRLKDYFSSPFEVSEDGRITLRCYIAGVKLGDDIPSSEMLTAYGRYISEQGKNIAETVVTRKDSEDYKRFFFEREVEKYLQDALEHDFFECVFQPIYSVKEERITSVEMLSRMRHPIYGYVSPELFVRILEKNGDSDLMTHLQLHRLFAFLKDNPLILEKLDSIKINLSPHELIAHDFGTVILEMITSYGLPCKKLQIEITETAVVEYSKAIDQAMKKLNDRGVRICMDDMGSGYANLSMLLQLPFHTIKLDRTLIAGITENERNRKFYFGLVEMLHRLGFVIVAEGVETEKELEVLKTADVDYMQGYYISKPISGDELIKLLS